MTTTGSETYDMLGGFLHPNWENRKAAEDVEAKRFIASRLARRAFRGFVAWVKADEPNMTTGDTQLYKSWDVLKGVAPYSVFSDKQNNLWFLDFGLENIGKIDVATGAVTLYPTPTKHSRPRRGRIDDQGRIWFGEIAGERIGMFDTKTEKFQEWEVPGRFFAPYDAMADKDGHVWSAGMNADRVLRLDPTTGQFVQYPLPHSTNVRRIFVDNSTKTPTLWLGNNHGASLVKVEVQD